MSESKKSRNSINFFNVIDQEAKKADLEDKLVRAELYKLKGQEFSLPPSPKFR
jgi:hypothetical protein